MPMIRVASGDLVYNVPTRITGLFDLFDSRALQLGRKFIATL